MPHGCSSSRSGSTPHHYTNDGVRLSELGEQPLAIGTAEPLVSEEGELSFSLPATKGVVVSFSGVPDAAGEAGHSQRRKPALPDLFRQKGAFSLLQPSLGSEISFSQLDSRRRQQQPILLMNLQAFLAEKLQMADRLQAAYGQQDRSSLTTANLVLDAHRQVFEAFIHSFTTYRPLLLKVRAAYEEALQDALTSQADNIHMKAQLAVLHQRKANAVDKARGSGNDAAVSGRGALYERLLEAQGRQEQAAASAAAEEAANAAATAELRAARAEAADLKLRIMLVVDSASESDSRWKVPKVRLLGGQVRGDRLGIRGNHIWGNAAVQPLSELGDGPRSLLVTESHDDDGNLKLLRECLCALKYSRMKRIEGGWAPG
ncbi:MAG: hypothetical protein FRX49_11021 [Trebouxia sp. A1-2]|nr:MAG: hypothetical protein FRX49_11021 [Trebouxia sp. A1-2]